MNEEIIASNYEKKRFASNYEDILTIVSSGNSFLLSPDWGRIFLFSKFRSEDQISDAQLKIICEACSKSTIEEIYMADKCYNDEAIEGPSEGRYNCVAEMIEKAPLLKLLSFDGHFPFKERDAKLIGEAIGKSKSLVIFDSYNNSLTYTKELLLPILDGVRQSESIRIFSTPNIASNEIVTSLLIDCLVTLISNDSPCKIQILDLVTYFITSSKDLEPLKRLFEALEYNTSVFSLVFNIENAYDDKKSIFGEILEMHDSILSHNFTLQQCLISSPIEELPDNYNQVLEKLERNKRISIFKRSFDSFFSLYMITIENDLPRDLRGVICELYLVSLSLNEEPLIRSMEFSDGTYPFTIEDVI